MALGKGIEGGEVGEKITSFSVLKHTQKVGVDAIFCMIAKHISVHIVLST